MKVFSSVCLAAVLVGCVVAADLPVPSKVKVEYLSGSVLDRSIDTAKPRFSWVADPAGGVAPDLGVVQVAYRIAVTHGGLPIWDSGKVSSSSSAFRPYDGPALKADTTYDVEIQWWSNDGRVSGLCPKHAFNVGLLTDADWSGAGLIGSDTQRRVRFPFSVDAGTAVTRAMLYVGTTGGAVVSLNGKTVGDGTGMSPWLTWEVFSVYRTIDLSSAIVPGSSNVLGFDLGSGFSGHPFFKAKLVVSVDGKPAQTWVSKPAAPWLALSNGPISFDNPWDGFTADYRLDTPGWNTKSFTNLTAWEPASDASSQGSNSTVWISSGVPLPAHVTTRKPIKMYMTPDNVPVFDFGQNAVGYASVTIKGAPAGTTVEIQHAEWLNANHTLVLNYSAHTPATFQKDRYTLSGTETEPLAPYFTWHGFQFASVNVTGFDWTPSLDDIVQVETRADVSSTGILVFPDAPNDPVSMRLTNLAAITHMSQVANLAGGLPTDCPTREKHGWLGDALSTSDEALYGFDMNSIYTRFLKGIIADQTPAGNVPGVIPNGHPSDASSVTKTSVTDLSWSTALVQIPVKLYQHTGDTFTLTLLYNQMKKYLELLIANADAQSGLCEAFTWGDWCALQARTVETKATGPACSAGNYVAALDAMSQIATLNGDSANANKWAAMAKAGRPAFHKAFYNATTGLYGSYMEDAQTLTSVPLAIDAVPADMKDSVVNALVDNVVKAFGTHQTYGSVGATHLYTQLSKNGHHDTAMGLAMQDSFPSYGHWLANGATTCWENWSGYADDTHPPTPTHNHIFLCGGLGHWLFATVGGITPAAPGYDTVMYAPIISPTTGPSTVSLTQMTVRGTAALTWKRKAAAGAAPTVEFQVTVPTSATGKVRVPLLGAATASFDVTVGGSTVWTKGAFVSGTAGVSAGEMVSLSSGDVVELTVTSGGFTVESSVSSLSALSALA